MPKPTINFEKFAVIKNETATSADLYFYGDIASDGFGAWVEEDQYPESIRNFLADQADKSLNIYFNSGGGNAFAGMAIYNMLKRHTGYKTGYVDGVAASISSTILFACDKIIIPTNAFLMIHKPWCLCAGNATELRKLSDDLDVLEGGMMNVYEANLNEGIDIADIKTMADAETWLNGTEAAKYFKIESGQAKEYAAYIGSMDKYHSKIPDELIKSAQAVPTETPEKVIQSEESDKDKSAKAKIKSLVIQGLTGGKKA